jgi:competence protein ComEC
VSLDIRLPKRGVQFNRTTLITVGLVASLVGLVLAKMGLGAPWWSVVAMALLVLLLYRRRSWAALVVVIMCGLVVGLWRGADMMLRIHPYTALYGRVVTLNAVANEDAVYGKNSQLSFDVVSSVATTPTAAHLPGRIKVSGFGEYMVYRGDTVEVSGKLYDTLGGRQAQMSYAKIRVIGHGGGWVDGLRRKFIAGMQNALPEPLASFGAGLLIGQRSTIPADVNQQLAAVGLTHLVAVSGYNLTIIVDAVRRLTGKRSKYQSFMLSTLLIGLFLLVTGLSASIVRAAIVSMLSLSAWYYGRRVKPLLLISLAAAVTALWSPLYIWGDISWYLSFLAFFGVLVIAPVITRRWYGEREPKLLHAVLIETSCAQIMTLPYILYVFNQVSIVSIVSNIIVVPLVPLGMLVALVAGLAGAYLPLVSGWLAWPARVLLTYMLDIAAVLAKMPHALLHGALTILQLAGLYGVILMTTTVIWRKNAIKRAIITDVEK